MILICNQTENKSLTQFPLIAIPNLIYSLHISSPTQCFPQNPVLCFTHIGIQVFITWVNRRINGWIDSRNLVNFISKHMFSYWFTLTLTAIDFYSYKRPQISSSQVYFVRLSKCWPKWYFLNIWINWQHFNIGRFHIKFAIPAFLGKKNEDLVMLNSHTNMTTISWSSVGGSV